MDANAVSVALVDEATHELVYIEATASTAVASKEASPQSRPRQHCGWVAEKDSRW
jgi:hypothetical protein